MAEADQISTTTKTGDDEHYLQALAGAFTEGVDLGPRDSHIRALCDRLEAELTVFWQEHAAVLSSSESDVPGVTDILDSMVVLSQRFKQVARLARTYRSAQER